MTQLSDQPALVNECTVCNKHVNLRRHIKEINGQYYAICYDCSDE